MFSSQKVLAALGSLLLLTMNTLAAGTPQLVVRADDMGSSHAANLAILNSATDGIVTSVEVMVVGPWYPEAVKMLTEHSEIDVGLHLVLSAEWDNIKWRPLTSCPSITDENGYFPPKIVAHNAFPGQSLSEKNWKIEEIEQELEAQIRFALKTLPRVSHLSAHMGCTDWNPEVRSVVQKLSAKYDLPLEMDNINHWLSLPAPRNTTEERVAGFGKMISRLEPAKTYMFLEHPAYDNDEMGGFGHIGYTNVGEDRQRVTELFTSTDLAKDIQEQGVKLVSYVEAQKSLPRSTPEAENVTPDFLDKYLQAVKDTKTGIDSIMVVRNGKVIGEHWLGTNAANIPHVMHSVSKTWTATAVGFAVQEGLLKVTDKVIDFFPDDLPENISDNLKELEVRHLLTMSVGHQQEPTNKIRNQTEIPWVKMFLQEPIVHKPGTQFQYNTAATYMLSAIVQKVTGQKVIDYLQPRLFHPLGITGMKWLESPQGINTGGYGLYVKTEDMAKLGQFFLQKGKWNGKQLLNEAWINEATSAKINEPKDPNAPNVQKSDWAQGYCYQMWRCRHNAFRADGMNGQYIIVIPEKNSVIAITATLQDMQAEINQVWDYILPALK